MALELTGKVQQILEIQKGEGANGPWQRGGFVIEYGDNFPKSVCCTVWGDKLNEVNALQTGDLVKVSIDLQSREFNGRWYTDVRPWRIEKVETTTVVSGGSQPAKGATSPPPPPIEDNDTSQTSANDDSTEDDLPF